MQEFTEHVESPGHTPGTLPDCPACDIELARQAYVQARRGTACPQDAMLMLDARMRRLVEWALLTDQIAETDGIDVRDALHRVNGVGDRSKAIIASWVAPGAGDWSGSQEDRRRARKEYEGRERARMEDVVLGSDGALADNDMSIEAQHIRETAASIRDHRASALRVRADELYDLHLEYERQVQQAVRDRNALDVDVLAAEKAQDWQAHGLKMIARREADRRLNEASHLGITYGQESKDLMEKADDLLAENAEYDRRWRREWP